MRILATADTHFPVHESLFEDKQADLFIHAGDLMYTGYPGEWYSRLEWLAKVNARVKFYVPGNHDFHVDNYKGIARAELRRMAKVRLLCDDTPYAKVGDLRILGVPFVTGLPGWAFNVSEEWLLDWLTEVSAGMQFDLVVSHAPIYGTLDAVLPEEKDPSKRGHVGCLAFNRWLTKQAEHGHMPRAWVHGHVHESFGQDKIASHGQTCDVYNVALCDRAYTHSNRFVEFEL